ncbi:MAG TPA: V-type ATP synthase subunit B, partial [Treponemataceae bacterium]|nr:V-type ATP synthase subunit B [Treponemataceae bacterium]
MKGVEYRGASSVDGPIVIVRRRENTFFGETALVRDAAGSVRTGRVIDLSSEYCVVQVFGTTSGLSLEGTSVEFLETPMELRVSDGIMGRIFNGLGKPIDGYPELYSSKRLSVNGYPINPYARVYPKDFIQTGISAIDGMNTLIRGQKLPVFSGNGLPHNRLTAQIIRQAKILSADDDFVMVFAGMGIKYDVARFFIDSFERSGVLSRVAMFLSLADAPSIERIVTPRCALTAAEYLAYERGMHVLVVLTD